MEKAIFNKLIALGMPLNGDFFEYWLWLLCGCYYNEDMLNCSVMCKIDFLSKHFCKSKSQIERTLRYGLVFIKDNIEKQYNYHHKITIETVLNLFKLYVYDEILPNAEKKKIPPVL